MPLAFPSWEGLGVGSSCLLPFALPVALYKIPPSPQIPLKTQVRYCFN
ncbi:MAG: hypothetical protein F6K56_23585 [Moorea sp. SIO3G5]|nr:hypothetical protein [Moorena sp. SIO3G5]